MKKWSQVLCIVLLLAIATAFPLLESAAAACPVCGSDMIYVGGEVASASGTNDYICPECGYPDVPPTPVHTHTYEVLTTIPATCTANGMVTYICSGCKDTTYATIPATGHNFSVTETVPTCTVSGSRVSVCSVCGARETETIPAAGHSYQTEYTSPTCTTAGRNVMTCSACGDTKTETIPAVGHNLIETETPATCGSEGERIVTCTRCDYTERTAIPAPEHEWEEKVTEPDCETPGERVKTCPVCGAEETEVIPPLGHDYEEAVTEATCTAAGEKTLTCKTCGHTETETIPPAEHNWEYRGDPSSEETFFCTEGSERLRVCTVCGTEETETVLPTEHRFSDWEIFENPTLFHRGMETRHCENCAYVEDQAVPRKLLRDSPGAIAAIAGAVVIAGGGAAFGLVRKRRLLERAARAAGKTAASLKTPELEKKKVLLCLNDSQASAEFIKLLGEKKFLEVTTVPFAQAESLPETAEKEKADLVVLSASAPYTDAAALVEKLGNTGAALITETGDKTALPASLRKIAGIAGETDSANRKLARLLLPIYKSGLEPEGGASAAGLIAEALGIPVVPTIIDCFVNGREIKETVTEGGGGFPDVMNVVGDIADILGIDALAKIANASGKIAEKKTRKKEERENV